MELRKAKKLVERINRLEPEVRKMSFPKCETTYSPRRELYKAWMSLMNIWINVFAFTREVARRTVGMRHFDVQLIGGIVLHKGKIAEMKTGEGKTLVATLPVVLNSLMNRNISHGHCERLPCKKRCHVDGSNISGSWFKSRGHNYIRKSLWSGLENPELAQKGLEENYCVWPEDFDGEFLPDEAKVKRRLKRLRWMLLKLAKRSLQMWCNVRNKFRIRIRLPQG